jgi:transcriptional regulator with XRE-family HTH domain
MKGVTGTPTVGAVAKLLRDARKARGLTLRKLEAILGITYSHLCRIERGDRKLPLDMLDRWCAALGLNRLDVRVMLLGEDLDPSDMRELALALVRRLDEAAAQAGVAPLDARTDLLLDLIPPRDRTAIAKRLLAV